METRAKEVKTLLSLIKKIKGKITMRDYFNDNATKEEALQAFYKSAIEKYPGITAPEE